MPQARSPHLSLTPSHFRPNEHSLFSELSIADGVWGGSPFPGWRGPNCHLSIERALVTGPLTPGYSCLTHSGSDPRRDIELIQQWKTFQPIDHEVIERERLMSEAEA